MRWLIVFAAVSVFVGYMAPAQEIPETPVSHVVEQGETLWGIAREYYPHCHTGERVYEIREKNGIEPNIQPGQVIKLP